MAINLTEHIVSTLKDYGACNRNKMTWENVLKRWVCTLFLLWRSAGCWSQPYLLVGQCFCLGSMCACSLAEGFLPAFLSGLCPASAKTSDSCCACSSQIEIGHIYYIYRIMSKHKHDITAHWYQYSTVSELSQAGLIAISSSSSPLLAPWAPKRWRNQLACAQPIRAL